MSNPKAEIHNKFFGSTNGEFYDFGPYDTREQCLNELLEEVSGYYGKPKKVWTGILLQHVPEIDTNSILEHISEHAYDECGEVAEGFLADVSEAAIADLSQRLDAVFAQWLVDHKIEANFGIMDETQEHEVKHEDDSSSAGVVRAVGQSI